MSYHSAPVSPGWIWASKPPSRKRRSSATWRESLTASGFYWPEWLMASLTAPPSGATCSSSTASPGEDLLTRWLEASRARTSVTPEGAKASRPETEAASGSSSPASLAKFDLDTCSWRTSQPSSTEGSILFSDRLPKWGSMRNGELYPQPTPEPRTCGSASSCWPTAGANDWKGTAAPGAGRGQLDEAAEQLWATPNSRDHKGAPGAGCRERGGHQVSLPVDVKRFPSSLPAQETETPGEPCSSTPRRLSPLFVAWLMGLPPEWTDLKPLETPWFQHRLASHLDCLLKGSN
jgi:hypothetical protein